MASENTLKNKSGDWFTKKSEDTLKNFLVPKIPSWLQTNHLTWLTIVWSILVVLFFYLGNENYFYLWFIPLFVVFQYITDLLDGAVGRFRNTGLVTWGYYTDHFFDFVFMVSILLGYGLILGFNIWLFTLLAIASGIMVHTFLLVSTSDTFRISFLKIGPTEGRILFIVFHIVVVIIGIQILKLILPYIVVITILGLLIMFKTAQKSLWKNDMMKKNMR